MKKFITSLMCVVMILTFIPCTTESVFAFNKDVDVELSTSYRMDDLWANGQAGGYRFNTAIPGDGRIRIWIRGYKKDIYDDYKIQNVDEYGVYRDWKKGADEMNSGWITVKHGTLTAEIWARDSVGNETLYIEYQAAGSYFGETEDNDTFATANPLVSGRIYEGNCSRISKDDYAEENHIDYDYYSIQLNSPGLVELQVKNLS